MQLYHYTTSTGNGHNHYGDKTMTSLPKFQIVIPHRHQSSVREIHAEADLLTQDERDDMHSAYEFFSVQEMLDWAEAYCGHQGVRVLAEVRDLAAELEAQA